MKKLNIVTILLLMCILLVACSSPKEGQTPSESTGLTQSSAETENESGAEAEQIVLEPDNPYVEVILIFRRVNMKMVILPEK